MLDIEMLQINKISKENLSLLFQELGVTKEKKEGVKYKKISHLYYCPLVNIAKFDIGMCTIKREIKLLKQLNIHFSKWI